MVTAVFDQSGNCQVIYGNRPEVKNLWQWDYGQMLRIQGLHLPAVVEIHFSLRKAGGESVTRLGTTKDGVTDVPIPEFVLENQGTTIPYEFYVFVYLTDETSGRTVHKITINVKTRPKPEVPGGGEDPDIFHEAVRKVAESADQAAKSERQAEGWAHGREDLPERAQDNAKYYSDQAATDAKRTDTDRKEVERLVESVSGIDQQVEKVEELTRQAQGAATKAGESEQASKEAQKLAESAKTATETAAAKTAEDRTAVDNAKTEVLKAKESVSSDRIAVESAKKEIDQLKDDIPTAVQDGVQKVNDARDTALGDISKAGTAHKTAVESAGIKAVETIARIQTEAVEAVNTSQTKAVEAVETAKTEAVKTVQSEGTTQTGKVTAEGQKQLTAVQQAAQAIVADREQIQANKSDIADLRQSKAGAVIERVSGETIQIVDSAVAGFEGVRILGRSTQAGVPTLDKPVQIENAGSKGNIDTKVFGSNLLDISLFTDEERNGITAKKTEDDGYHIWGSTGGEFFVGQRVKMQLSKGYYYISDKNHAINSKYRLLIRLTNSKTGAIKYMKHGQFEVNENDEVFSYFQVEPNQTVDVTLYPMINAGKEKLPYEPYKPVQPLTLQTPNGLPGLPVKSGGNYTDENGQQWICDEIDLGRGKYVQWVKEVLINHNSKIQNSLGAYGAPEITTVLSRFIDSDIKKTGALLCREMPRLDIGNWKNESESVYCTETSIDFRISRERLGLDAETTTEENHAAVLKYLEAHPLYCLAERSEPFERELTPEEIKAYRALHTNYPTTVIINDSGAGMEAGYVADTKLYITKKIKEAVKNEQAHTANLLSLTPMEEQAAMIENDIDNILESEITQ